MKNETLLTLALWPGEVTRVGCYVVHSSLGATHYTVTVRALGWCTRRGLRSREVAIEWARAMRKVRLSEWRVLRSGRISADSRLALRVRSLAAIADKAAGLVVTP